MDDDGNSQAQVRSSPYASPMYNYASSIVFMTSPDDDLRDMELALRSLKEDKDGATTKIGDPLMNDYGINKILMLVRSILSRSTFMSNMKKDMIPMLIDLLADTIAKTLMINASKFEIRDITTRDDIIFIAEMTAYIALSRGLDEGERRFWKGSTQEITTSVMGGNQKSGLVGKLLGWGGKS